MASELPDYLQDETEAPAPAAATSAPTEKPGILRQALEGSARTARNFNQIVSRGTSDEISAGVLTALELAKRFVGLGHPDLNDKSVKGVYDEALKHERGEDKKAAADPMASAAGTAASLVIPTRGLPSPAKAIGNTIVTGVGTGESDIIGSDSIGEAVGKAVGDVVTPGNIAAGALGAAVSRRLPTAAPAATNAGAKAAKGAAGATVGGLVGSQLGGDPLLTATAAGVGMAAPVVASKLSQAHMALLNKIATSAKNGQVDAALIQKALDNGVPEKIVRSLQISIAQNAEKKSK